MTTKRTYEDGCAAAHALNLVGERWALLVVRELLLGARRFCDLKDNLPGISPNVLSQRLKDLEASGVVERQQLPPPAASWVYALTPWGQELEPVLQHLGRWGARSPERPAHAPISLATLISAMKTMFQPGDQADVTPLALRVGREEFSVTSAGGQLCVERGRPPTPAATITADVATLGEVLFNGLPLAQAEADGRLQVGGDRALVERLTRHFPMPEPAAPCPPTPAR